MKILVVSRTPWSKSNSFGSSFSGIFEGIPDIEIANIYCSHGTPDKIVKQGFQITERNLILNLLNKSVSTGAAVASDQTPPPNSVTRGQQQAYSWMRIQRWQIFFWFRDAIWLFGRWKSAELREFIRDFAPNIIFQPVYYSSYASRIALYAKKESGAPMVGYISDDNYTLRQFSLSPLFWIDRFIKRKKVKEIIDVCEQLYVISDIQKIDYDKCFKKDCKVLTKLQDFSGEPPLKNTSHSSLRLVYSGNIGNNRWKSLSKIVDALSSINKNGIRVQMQIYSATKLTKKMGRFLNRGDTSRFMGAVEAEEIPAIHSEADILVHVEPMDLKGRLLVRQSFSTKIVDYLHQAKCILCVGPAECASISYFINYKAGCTATTTEEIVKVLDTLLNQPDLLSEYGLRAWTCGQAFHDRVSRQKLLLTDLEEVIKKKTEF